MVKTKNKLITIRINDEDKQKIMEAAKRERVTMSAFIETAALNKAVRVNRKGDDE
jgi:uncharacterized protein (DUF1778 family)